jgi:hypothetical protein
VISIFGDDDERWQDRGNRMRNKTIAGLVLIMADMVVETKTGGEDKE